MACVSSGKSAIVQCKHRSSPLKTVSEDAVEEACNAVKHYDLLDPKLYVVSNAGSFTSNCVTTAEQKHVSLMGRGDCWRSAHRYITNYKAEQGK